MTQPTKQNIKGPGPFLTTLLVILVAATYVLLFMDLAQGRIVHRGL